MQIQSFPNYTKIVNLFWAANARGCVRFETIYEKGKDFAYSLLLQRDWRRFYLWKKCCKWLNKHDKEWLAITDPEGNRHYSLQGKRLCSNFLQKHLDFISILSAMSKKPLDKQFYLAQNSDAPKIRSRIEGGEGYSPSSPAILH